MCGLTGVAGDINNSVERMFQCMLQLDTVRGPHSTGIAAVSGGKKVNVLKGVGTPWDLMETKKWDEMFRSLNKVLLGHNRWATKGAVNKANAHPFEFDSVVGAHNGTLRSVYALDDYKDFEVDSENLYHHMDKNGVYDTIPKLNGAFALTWYNKDDHTINLIRNDERPLFYCFSEDMRSLMWASEEWMLLVAANQCKVKLTKLFELPVGVLHTFDIPAASVDKFDKIRTRKLELYKYTPPAVTGNVFTKQESKVVTLRPKEEATTGKVQRPFTEYQKYIDKEVVFFLDKKGITSWGQVYLQCWLQDDEDISVRVFAQEDGPIYKQMMFSTNCFKGLAKSYGESAGKYLSIDLRTVQEVIPGDDIAVELFTVYGGELVTEEVFDERSKHGCAWCSAHVCVQDAPEMKWIGKTNFICPDCVEQPDVKEYLVHAK